MYIDFSPLNIYKFVFLYVEEFNLALDLDFYSWWNSGSVSKDLKSHHPKASKWHKALDNSVESTYIGQIMWHSKAFFVNF